MPKRGRSTSYGLSSRARKVRRLGASASRPLAVRQVPTGLPSRMIQVPQGIQKLRYVVNTGVVNYGITRGNLLSTFLMTNATFSSNPQYSMVQSIRVSSILLYAPALIYSGGESIAVEWFTTQSGFKVKAANACDTATSSRIFTKPPRNSAASWFSNTQSSQGEILFVLTAPSGSLIEIGVEMTMFSAQSQSQQTVTTTLNWPYANQLLMNALDQTGGKIRPPAEMVSIY